MRSADVAIVGAGVIGAAIAYALSCATRLRIVVIERNSPGCEASNAAAGVLAVASVRARRGALFDLRRASAARFPELVAALEDEASVELEYHRCGLLSLAFSTAQAADLQALVQHRVTQGLRGAWLDRAALIAAEPAVNPAASGGAFFPDDAAIDSAGLVRGLVEAARRRGVEFRLRTAVHSVLGRAGTATVHLEGGCIEAGRAVVAAGAWSGEILAPHGIKVPVRPARGEMAAVRPVGWRLHHILSQGDGYLIPRAGGDVLIGSTSAFVGFDRQVTPAGVSILLARARHMVPAMSTTTPVRVWAGLRPCSTIRRPIIAPLPGMEEVILASGHHRDGVLLAPITAQLVTEMIGGVSPSLPLRPLSYRRH